MNNQLTTNNRQLKLKVCGLTQLNQIQELIKLDVDFLGFIFYEKSPRYVLNHLNLNQIAEIPYQKKVGVFVNESIKGIVEIATEAQLDYIQLHGDETEKYVSKLKQILAESVKIIKVIRVGNQTTKEIQKVINHQSSFINYFLFDTDSKAFGGTGQTFDWQILNNVLISKPYFLSGGISLGNLEDLKILNQKPFAIDINSKFEIDVGVKNLEKIEKLIKIINC